MNFAKHCCKTEVFNNPFSNNGKVDTARTEKKLLENHDNNNFILANMRSFKLTQLFVIH